MTGCTQKTASNEAEKGIRIMTSFYPIYIHTINIAKDIPGVEVLNMTQPQTGCLHDYQLSPDDIKTLDESDIFVINGGGMESFMDKVLSQLSDLPIIDASKNIDLIEEEGHLHDQIDEHHHTFNPHVWVSVTGAIDQVKEIAKELAIADPGNKDLYEENAQVYIAKLEELKDQMHEVLDDIPNKNIVTFHEAFPYFAQEFAFNIVGTIVTEPGSEPSAKELSAVIQNIEDHDVQAIFAEPQFTSKSASLISEETGVHLYILDPIVTGESNGDQEDDYINKMKVNLETLKEADRKSVV